jgi:poly(A) polymerase
MHILGQDLSEPLFIVQRLREHGFEAYFAGGWVRDYLLGRSGSDVDIATDAHPDQIATLFEKTVPVGASFGVMIVVINGTPYEVATFRRDGDYLDGRRPEAVEFCGRKEDASRRDFTINGMFFDPIHHQVIDDVEGQKDLQERILRAIGNPSLRFQEDRLRILRAIRFVTRFGLRIEDQTREAIKTHASHLREGVSAERIAQELSKMAQAGELLSSLHLMKELGLLQWLFPNCDPLPDHLDPDLPLILQLCSLYRSTPGLAWPTLAERLKLSGEEKRMAETLIQAYELLKAPHIDRVAWTHFLAKPWAEECLEALFCWGDPFPYSLAAIQALQEELVDHIHRASIRQPIVSAAHLLARGVPPGPQLGHLLKEAERVAIEQDLESPEEILAQLPLPRGALE